MTLIIKWLLMNPQKLCNVIITSPPPTHSQLQLSPMPLILTTPSGSTSSRCFGWPPCWPVSTYWPGVVPDSRTRKSPSLLSSFSAFLRLRGP